MKSVLVALLCLLSVLGLSSCAEENPDRQIGDPITETEAETLAELLNRNFTAGGAAFKVVAPYAENTTFTYSGVMDFTTSTGSGTAVTDYSGLQPSESRILYFTTDEVTFGDVPGLTDAMAAVGVPGVNFMRRQIFPGQDLIDTILALLPRLAASEPDNPAAYLERDYTFQGQTTIDGQFAALFSFGQAQVAVGADDKMMLQYVTTLPNSEVRVTITLTDHGPQTVTAPPPEQTVAATDYPQVRVQVGV
ncbi:MAG: hypothetical protein M3400_03165 [Actinomycetota bacterium]|nr:hypothetical protein [Actinomycetota bacterium]